MEQDNATSANKRLPLTLVLEGKSWLMTAVLEAATALWMVALAADGERLFVENIQVKDKWQQKLLNYFLYILIGAVLAALSVGALAMNFRPAESNHWRRQSCRSVFALIIVDYVVVNHICLVVESITGKHKNLSTNIASVPATVFLTVIGSVCTLIYNWMFLREFGWCTCCRTKEFGDYLVRRSQKWGDTMDLPVAKVAKSRLSSGWGEPDIKQALLQADNLPEKGNIRYPVVPEAYSEPITPYQTADRCLTKEFLSLRIPDELNTGLDSSLSTGTIDFIAEHSAFESLDTLEAQEIGITQSNGSPNPDRKLPISKPSMITISQKTTFSAKLKRIWSSLKEEPGHFRYPVWIKSAVFASAVVLIYSCIRSISRIYSFVDYYDLNRDRVTSIMQLSGPYLKTTQWEIDLETLTQFTLVKVILLIDVIVKNMKWAACVGYPLGTLFSLYGLINVLGQHKKMSIGVSNSFRMLKSQPGGAARAVIKWQEFQKKYPVLGACFFLAILYSTAVIQLQIIGIVISVLLGIVTNLTKVIFVAERFGFYFWIYMAVTIINQSVFIIFKSSLLSKDQFHIKHPRWFNFCLVVLSMIHLLLGILYALWRVLYLVITTVLILNRLDVSLFTTVMIQEDSEQYHEQNRIERNDEAV